MTRTVPAEERKKEKEAKEVAERERKLEFQRWAIVIVGFGITIIFFVFIAPRIF